MGAVILIHPYFRKISLMVVYQHGLGVGEIGTKQLRDLDSPIVWINS